MKLLNWGQQKARKVWNVLNRPMETFFSSYKPEMTSVSSPRLSAARRMPPPKARRIRGSHVRSHHVNISSVGEHVEFPFATVIRHGVVTDIRGRRVKIETVSGKGNFLVVWRKIAAA